MKPLLLYYQLFLPCHPYFLFNLITLFSLLEVTQIKFHNDDCPLGRPPEAFTISLGGHFLVMLVGERDIGFCLVLQRKKLMN